MSDGKEPCPRRACDQAVRLVLTSEARHLAKARRVAREAALRAGLDCQEADQVSWAVDEALANVIRHGYAGRAGQPIELEFAPVRRGGRHGVEVTLRDYGKQVDPATIRPRGLDSLRPGGLGVHIIRTVMDEVVYQPADGGGMLLRMIRYRRRGTD